MACGGLCATARDWARFGLCLARDGKNLSGEQVLPRDYVVASRTSKAARAVYAAAVADDDWTSAYHNKLWILGEQQEVCCMIGVNGAASGLIDDAICGHLSLISRPFPAIHLSSVGHFGLTVGVENAQGSMC